MPFSLIHKYLYISLGTLVILLFYLPNCNMIIYDFFTICSYNCSDSSVFANHLTADEAEEVIM